MLEKLFELIAPENCLVCQKEGKTICDECAIMHLINKKPSCFMCNSLNDDGKTCKNCRNKSMLNGAMISYRYEGFCKDIVYDMKFYNNRAAARYLSGRLIYDKKFSDYLVTCVPSDGKTQRQRGYNPSQIIAKSYSKARGYNYADLMIRIKHERQVGKTKAERLDNVKDNFTTKRSLKGEKIILIDDVITTGATVSECARVLKAAGAKSVWAIAVAKG